MIKLIVNGRAVVLKRDFTIRLEFNSPVFDDDAIKGSRSYWFDIPVVPANRKTFGFPEIPSVAGKYRLLDNVSLYFGGYRLITGKLLVKKTGDHYRALLTSIAFGPDNKDKNLTEYNWGASINLGSSAQDVVDHANNKVTQGYPETNYNFPMIYNPDFYGDKNNAYNKPSSYPAAHFPMINAYSGPSGTFMKNYVFTPDSDPDVPDGTGNFYTLVPMFYLQYILSVIFGEYKPIGRFVTDSAFQQLMLYNGYALDDNEDNYSVDADTASYPGSDYHYLQYENKSADSTMSISDDSYGRTILTVQQEGYHQFVLEFEIYDPNFNNGDYVLALMDYDPEGTTEALSQQSFYPNQDTFTIKAEFAVKFVSGDIGKKIAFWLEPEHFNKDQMVFNLSTLHVNNYSYSNLNVYAKQIDPANHIPQVTVKKLLNGIKDIFGIAYYFDDLRKTVQLFIKDDLFLSQSKNISDLVDPDTIEVELNEPTKRILEYSFKDDGFAEDNFKDWSGYNMAGEVDAFIDAPDARGIKDVLKVKAENRIYKVDRDPEKGNIWKGFTDIKQRVQLSDQGAEERKEIEVAPLLMHGIYYRGSVYLASLYSVPKIKQPGYSVLYNSNQDQEGFLRIFNWMGLRPYSYFGVDYSYPLATSGQYDSKGNKISPFSLFLNGPEGVAESFHRQIENFLRDTETVKVDANTRLSLKDLLALIEVISMPQDGDVGAQKRWLLINNVKYLPKKMDVEISPHGIKSARFELIKKAHG